MGCGFVCNEQIPLHNIPWTEAKRKFFIPSKKGKNITTRSKNGRGEGAQCTCRHDYVFVILSPCPSNGPGCSTAVGRQLRRFDPFPCISTLCIALSCLPSFLSSSSLPPDDIRRLFRHRINSTTRMRPRQQRDNTRIHHPQSLNSINPQLSIHHASQLSRHQRRRTRQMSSGTNRRIPRRFLQIFLRRNLQTGR